MPSRIEAIEEDKLGGEPSDCNEAAIFFTEPGGENREVGVRDSLVSCVCVCVGVGVVDDDVGDLENNLEGVNKLALGAPLALVPFVGDGVGVICRLAGDGDGDAGDGDGEEAEAEAAAEGDSGLRKGELRGEP